MVRLRNDGLDEVRGREFDINTKRAKEMEEIFIEIMEFNLCLN